MSSLAMRSWWSMRCRIVSMLVLILMVAALPSMSFMSPGQGVAGEPQCTLVPSEPLAVPVALDSTTMDYLSTDFQKEIPSYEEIRSLNQSALDATCTISGEAPYVPTESLPSAQNGTLSSSDDSRSDYGLLGGYFEGHTWASQFGPHDRNTRAVPVTPALEGHWFPQAGYARITYLADVASTGTKAHIRIERDMDSYSRYFRVYINDVQKLNVVVSSWEGDVSMDHGGVQLDRITLEMYYGGYVQRGWKLRYYHLFDSQAQPCDSWVEEFQSSLYSELVYRVPMGPAATLDIETVNIQDPSSRYLYVYVDGSLWQTLYSPGAYHINLPVYYTPGLHELKFVLYYGNGGEHPKGWTHCYVNYEFMRIEADWMAGWYGWWYYDHSQRVDVFGYLEAYWVTHDYRRIEFVRDEAVPLDYDVTWDEYVANYRNVYYDKLGWGRWIYGLFGHYCDPINIWGWGSLNFGFVIADQASGNWDAQVWILMHEFGHTQAMAENSGGVPDIYGSNRVISYHYYHCSSWDQYLAWARSWW